MPIIPLSLHSSMATMIDSNVVEAIVWLPLWRNDHKLNDFLQHESDVPSNI